ncbi:hypothetical protein Verru16b_00675 [Lacunisphaera limnophila]|uniref:Uncharacterized protein n=1 Tax=Lacunisphaera limnophila TaxID=1838286 RepID=A0A1D8ARV4_9BACT|nr:hypothetical protein [Lacunisphaera limnophila]AOS43623.1 hypothetical protein Verru16b_00675 [Lacunisphaera limnophila]
MHPIRFAALSGLVIAVLAAAETSPGPAQVVSVENGTDPTKLLHTLEAKYEYIDLNRGVSSGTLRINFTQPLGPRHSYKLRYQVPVATLGGQGNSSHGIGDASLQLGHVFGLTKAGGYVAMGEMIFDTASRRELGTGQNVFKGTLIMARFLPGGIFAPAIVQSNRLWGDALRAKVNATTFDFYYVPKFADPRNLVTFDPALNVDWQANKEYLSLAVTYGRVVGKAFGGNAILFVKPTVFAGRDRPGSWGLEAGYKLVGF